MSEWGQGTVNNSIGWGQGKDNTTNGWGTIYETSNSGDTALEITLVAPVNTVAPAITGTAQVGSTLTCSTGTWSGSPTYAYQWKRNGSNIGGATNSTYTLVTADAGTSVKCTVTATNGAGSASADSNTVSPTFEADAQAFITAASITDPTQQSAVNQLVIDLKGYSLWTKMKAVYPFIGGSSSAHSYNLKNTAQYQISWSGGITHNANGVTFGGVNGYGDTGLNDNTVLSTNNAHISIYSRTDVDGLYCDMGAANGVFETNIFSKYSNTLYLRLQGTNSGIANSGTSQKLFISNRVIALETRGMQDGVLKVEPVTSQGKVNGNIFIGALNRPSSTTAFYSTRNYAFASIGDGLTDQNMTDLTTAVQTFQTTLSRNV